LRSLSVGWVVLLRERCLSEARWIVVRSPLLHAGSVIYVRVHLWWILASVRYTLQ